MRDKSGDSVRERDRGPEEHCPQAPSLLPEQSCLKEVMLDKWGICLPVKMPPGMQWGEEEIWGALISERWVRCPSLRSRIAGKAQSGG